jgi:DNA replication protein DnaC
MSPEKAGKYRLKIVSDTSASETERSSETDVCPTCDGTGMEIVAGVGARICSCRRRANDDGHRLLSRIPRRYESCTFNTYAPVNASQRAAKRLASEFALEFPAVDRGLLFTGDVGVGKTHLAVSIIKGLLERGFKCRFYEFGGLLKQIQDSYNPNTLSSELNVLAPVFSSDVLVLDELGASKPTDWVQDTLTHIINTRYNDKKFTIITTNYPDETNDPRKETLEDRIGVRARSRLFEMCRTVHMSGPDHRRLFDQQ